MPTLVLRGNQDGVVLPKYTEVLVKKLKANGVVAHKLIDGGHEFPKQTTDYAGPVLSLIRDVVNQKEQGYEHKHLVASPRSSFA